MKNNSTITLAEALFLGLALVLLAPADTSRRKPEEIRCENEQSIEELDALREQAVAEERYEYAAVLRDKIAQRKSCPSS